MPLSNSPYDKSSSIVYTEESKAGRVSLFRLSAASTTECCLHNIVTTVLNEDTVPDEDTVLDEKKVEEKS